MEIATVTEALVARLKADGVEFIYGVPGGECNLDFIAAAEKLGVRFILTRTETSASIMACVTADLTGTTGVAMTTRGPGLAAATNGVAYADLDRSPMLLIADGYEDDQGYIAHQRIDQTAILAPMTRASSSLAGGNAVAELDRLVAATAQYPQGPAYLEVSGSRIRGKASSEAPARPVAKAATADAAGLDQARSLLAKAKKPLILAGLQARSAAATEALRTFAKQTGIPVMTSYKAKGVMSEHDPLGLGLYAGGVVDEPLISSADLLLLYGFDTVEGPPSPWKYKDKVMVELTEHVYEFPLFTPNVSLVGAIDTTLGQLASAIAPVAWTADALAAAKAHHFSAARTHSGDGISPDQLVDAAIAAFPANTRITIDAGAHMLPVLHLWQCAERNQSLISRGLSTMGFAVPAAIAASLVDPDRPTVAFTGDGGIMMVLGELGTAIQFGAKPIVVVFNDSSLTLIGAKQRRRQMAAAGVDFSHTDFAQIAAGFGWNSHSVSDHAGLAPAFADALARGKPTLIDVQINPESYDAQILAIRG